MKIFRRAVVLFILLAAVAGWGAFALARGADLGWARGWIAGQLTQSLQRPVGIDGDITLTVGQNVVLELADISIANAVWGSRPHLAQARRVSAAVDLRSLWEGPVVISGLQIENGSVYLERAADGSGNWSLGPDTGAPLDPESLPIVEQMTVQAMAIHYDAAALTRPVALQLDAARAWQETSGFLRLDADGRLNEESLALHLQSSPLRVLLGGRDISLRLRALLDDVEVDAAARFDDIATPERALADVRIAAPDAARVGRLLGLPDPGPGPLRVEARITPQPQDLRLHLAAQAGGYELTATGDTEQLTDLRGLDADIAGRGVDFSAVAGILGWTDAPPGAFEIAGRVRSDADTVTVEQATITLADTTFTLSAVLDHLPQAELRRLSLDIRGEQLERFRALFGLPGIIGGPFRLTADIAENDGGEDRLQLNIENRAGTFQAAGVLGAMPHFHGTDLRMTGSGKKLAVIGKALGLDWLPTAPFQLDTRLQWTQQGLRIDGGWLTAGKDRLEVAGRVAPRPLAPGTALQLSLSGPDLRSVGRMANIAGLPAVRYEVRGSLERLEKTTRLRGVQASADDTRLRLDGTLTDTAGRAGSRFDFDLGGEALERWARAADWTLPRGPFSARGGLAIGAESVQLDKVTLGMGGASGTASGRFARSRASGQFDVRMAGPDLARLLPEPGDVGKYVSAFDLVARGRWTKQRWSFEEARLRAGDDEIRASGVLDLGKEAAATAMPVALRVASLERTGALFGLYLPDLPAQFEGRLSGTTKRFEVADLQGRLGDDAFRGRLALLRGDPLEVSLALYLQHLDLARLFADGDRAARPAGRSAARNARLIPDWPLPTGWMGAFDGDLELRVANLASGATALGTALLRGRLQDRELMVDQLVVEGTIGRVDLQGGLSARRALPQVSVRGEFRDYSSLLLLTDDVRRFDIDLHLLGQGRTLRELMASLDGRVRAIGGPGKTPPNQIDRLYGDTFTRIITTINPFLKSDETVNSICTVLPLQIRAGVVASAPTLISLSDKLNIVAYGTLDLGNERLDLNFKTEARKGIGVSAAQLVNPFIKVTGTLADPRVTLDPKGTLVSGSAAVLTGGLSILASTLWNRAFREKDPCGAVLKAADKAASGDEYQQDVLRRAKDFLGL
ncbi:MAG: AsmA family protein [Gammaproteobacteria bacterium]|nr:AsmA family protein [Gammaproteobacteria bacterium]